MIENDLEDGETETDGPVTEKSGMANTILTNVDSDVDSANVDSDIYEMCGDLCGKCIIFNQNFSSKDCKLNSRYGTMNDRDRLHNLFRWLKFKVKIYEDKTKDEMEKILKVEARDERNEEFKCLVVCILSHGQEGCIYTADGKLMELNEILNRFDASRCESLKNKPKIFIVQACRIERPLNYITRTDASQNNDVNTGTNDLVAINADQVLCHSTSYGSYALRHTLLGSPFIQTFCEVYEERAFDQMSFYDLALEINKRFGNTNSVMCAMEHHRLRKKLYFKPETQFNVMTDEQRHVIRTIWNVVIISHSSEKYVEELENQVGNFMVLKDKINKHIISIHRSRNLADRMYVNQWKEKECNGYIKRYYSNVDFFLFNYGSKDDIPDGFKSFIEKNKPSFVIRNYNLFKHFEFLKLADALNFQQKESLKRIKHMDHIGFDPRKNAIYFFKISDRKTVYDIRVDIEDCATFVRMFFLLHQKELENKISCLVSFVVVPTESLLEKVSKICKNCEQYLITKDKFSSFDESLCKKIRNTANCANKKDRIYLKDEELKYFKYDMKGIFACMAAQDGNLIPNLTESTSEQLKHIEIFLYPQQMEIVNFDDKRVVLKGSYGSGKTIIGRILLKHLCFDLSNKLIYYINCGASSHFTEDMEKYVADIDENNKVFCLHNRNALGNILKVIKQSNSAAAKIHLIFEEVSLDEISEEDILSFSAALNQPPFDEIFCYIICQAMSKQRSFTDGLRFKPSFSNQEEILKRKSGFEIKKLKIAARNTQNIDQLVEIGVKHLENAANKFFFKTIDNNPTTTTTSSESFKQKEDQNREVIQSQNQIQISYVENTPAKEHEEEHGEEHKKEIDKEPFNKRPLKAKEVLSNLDASLKSVNICENHEDQDVKKYLKSEFKYQKHSDLLHQIEGSKPRLYFPLDKKDDFDQFEEVYLLMQCFKDLLNDFFDNDENIILIHFEKVTPETVLKAVDLFERMEETKIGNIIFKSCFDVQGLEYKNVIIVLSIGEYHMRHYLIEAITRCKESLAFLVVKESLKGADQDVMLKIIQEWEGKDLITKFNQYSTKKLSEHKEKYESSLCVCPIQISDDEIKKESESIEKYLNRYKQVVNEEELSPEDVIDIAEIETCDNENLQVIIEIANRISQWKTFGRVLGLEESFLRHLQMNCSLISERNHKIIETFSMPPNPSWSFWRQYLNEFEDGQLVIEEMEGTFIDLITQIPNTVAHVITSDRLTYVGHPFQRGENFTLDKEYQMICVRIGLNNFQFASYQEFSEWMETQQHYMDKYIMLNELKAINFFDEKVCPILQTLENYLDAENDSGFAVKGYNFVNHFCLFKQGVFAKEVFNDSYFCFLANDNVVLYLTKCSNGACHALHHSLRNVQIANILHTELQSNNITQINIIIHNETNDSTKFCKQCIDNDLFVNEETFTDVEKFTLWYNKLIATYNIQNKINQSKGLLMTGNEICIAIKKDMIGYQALLETSNQAIGDKNYVT